MSVHIPILNDGNFLQSFSKKNFNFLHRCVHFGVQNGSTSVCGLLYEFKFFI